MDNLKSGPEDNVTLDKALEKVSDFIEATEGEGIWHHNAKELFKLMRGNLQIGEQMCEILSKEGLDSVKTIKEIANKVPWGTRVSEEAKRTELIKAIHNVRVNEQISE